MGRSLLLRSVPFPVVLALRYLRSTRRDAFASFLSAVAAGGIGLGVAALILSLAVISGFQEALRGELLGRTPQIEVELPAGLDEAAAAAARAAARRLPGVLAAQVEVRRMRSRAPPADPRGCTCRPRSPRAGGWRRGG